QVMAELQDMYSRVRRARPEIQADLQLMFSQLPSDVAIEAPVVRALDAALRASGEEVRLTGMSAWTDAALLNDAGIPAICCGPGDITLAHAAEEYIQIQEIQRATQVLTAMALEWCGQ